MMQHRNSVAVSIKLSAYPDLQRCLNDTGLRVMVFCAASNTGIQDVTFPHQCELKVNGGEVKANLRGIKNRPGSTRPVDITDLLRLKPPTYSNNLEFTYALTNKEGYRASKQPAHVRHVLQVWGSPGVRDEIANTVACRSSTWPCTSAERSPYRPSLLRSTRAFGYRRQPSSRSVRSKRLRPRRRREST